MVDAASSQVSELVPPKTIIVSTYAEAIEIDWLRGDVWDFETTGLYWFRDQPYALAVLIDDQPYVAVGEAMTVARGAMLRAPRVIAYNAKFDMHFATKNVPPESPDWGEIIDPSVALFLLDENRFSGAGRGGLKAAVKELFGYQMVDFETMLGRISEETGEYKTRKCKTCTGKGWRGRDHHQCETCAGIGVQAAPIIRNRQRRIDEVDLHVMAQYAGEDVWWTKRVWEWCETELARHSVLRGLFFDVQMPLLVTLYQAEHRGIRIDRAGVVALREKYLARIAEIDADIIARCGVRPEGAYAIDDENDDDAETGELRTDGLPDLQSTLRINLASPQQVDWFLFTFLGLKRPPFKSKRKKADGSRVESKWQTDESALLWLAKHSGHPVPKLLWERRKCAKYVGTYLDNILEWSVCSTTSTTHTAPGSSTTAAVATGASATETQNVWVLYPNFNQTSAKTGRLSSSKPLNLQNIPRLAEFRSLFIARPGKLLLIADAKQIELRFLAHFSDEPALVDAYKDPDRDLHQETADFLGLPGKDGRYVAKTANFAEVYEVFGTTLAMQLFRDTEGALDWTSQQAQDVLDRIRAGRPKVKAWKKHVVAKLKALGYIKTIEGRYRRLPGIKEQAWGLQKYAERQGINATIQGSVADLFSRLLTMPLIRGILLLQVHDEVVCEIDAAGAAFFCTQVKQAIEGFTDRYRTRVPILADVATGTDWSAKP